MIAEFEEVSKSEINDVIAAWRDARLSDWFVSLPLAGDGLMGKIRDLGPTAVAGSRGPLPPLPDAPLSEAERVQRVVEGMPDDIRRAFEAFHLGLVHGDRTDWPHAARANMLGIPRRTYYNRVQYGWNIIRDWYVAYRRV